MENWTIIVGGIWKNLGRGNLWDMWNFVGVTLEYYIILISG